MATLLIGLGAEVNLGSFRVPGKQLQRPGRGRTLPADAKTAGREGCRRKGGPRKGHHDDAVYVSWDKSCERSLWVLLECGARLEPILKTSDGILGYFYLRSTGYQWHDLEALDESHDNLEQTL